MTKKGSLHAILYRASERRDLALKRNYFEFFIFPENYICGVVQKPPKNLYPFYEYLQQSYRLKKKKTTSQRKRIRAIFMGQRVDNKRDPCYTDGTEAEGNHTN